VGKIERLLRGIGTDWNFRWTGFGPIAVSGAPKLLPKGDNGIAIAPPLNIRTLQY